MLGSPVDRLVNIAHVLTSPLTEAAVRALFVRWETQRQTQRDPDEGIRPREPEDKPCRG